MGTSLGRKHFSEGNIIAGNVAEFPSNEREILEPQGIKSILIIPIIIDDKFWGFIGFDNCEDVRKWSETEQSFLETAAKNLKAGNNKVPKSHTT